MFLKSPLNSSVYRVDGVIQYDSVNRFQEFYNFQNYILNNATDNFTVGLYNLNDSNGEEFTITYKDANFVPVSNALVNIQRKYIDEGLFKTIEIPKTSAKWNYYCSLNY